MNLYTEKLKEHFKAQPNFSKQDLFGFFTALGSPVSESDVYWYLYALKQEGLGYKDTFLLLTKADDVLLERYVFETQNPIVITKIVSKSPVKKVAQNGQQLKIPKLEKLLVDVFSDDTLFMAYKGASQQSIFENALTHYDINFKTLFAYAERRKKEAALRTYLYQNFQFELKLLLE